MGRIQLAGTLLLGTMLMVGCTETAPTELADTPQPVFNFSNGPANPGPFVVRSDFNNFLLVSCDGFRI